MMPPSDPLTYHCRSVTDEEITHYQEFGWVKLKAFVDRGYIQTLLDIGREAASVDGAVEHAWRVDAVAAQRRNQGQRLPVAMRHPALQSVTAWCPTPDRRHVGLGPGFIDEDQPSRIEAALVFLPLGPSTRDVRTILLAWQNGFF